MMERVLLIADHLNKAASSTTDIATATDVENFAGDNLADGRFRSPAELKARFEAMGIDAGAPLVCYCGSGVTATHNILALLIAGYPEPALYPGSWSGWITDPSRPIATGS